ncbi:MAG: hypothetical protein IH609_15525 [Dehalococcoidia bacterium]|nr:hypothetical protein [Dehalococcoidia bacterium]
MTTRAGFTTAMVSPSQPLQAATSPADGARFERLLTEAGLTREEVFVTNAALCLPLDVHGRNRPPSAGEVAACSGWLGETIAVVKPALVVTLGAIALTALARIEPHGLILREHLRTVVPWRGAGLTALYHPGARSQVHRPWPHQVNDWRALGTFVRACKDNSKNPGKNSPAGVDATAIVILR